MENCDGMAGEQNSKAICDGQLQNCDGEVRHNVKMCQELWWVYNNPSQAGTDCDGPVTILGPLFPTPEMQLRVLRFQFGSHFDS